MISYSALIDLSIVANNETNRRFILQLTVDKCSEVVDRECWFNVRVERSDFRVRIRPLVLCYRATHISHFNFSTKFV